MHYCQSSNDSLSEQAAAFCVWGGLFLPLFVQYIENTARKGRNLARTGFDFYFFTTTTPLGGAQVWGFFFPLWFQ